MIIAKKLELGAPVNHFARQPATKNSHFLGRFDGRPLRASDSNFSCVWKSCPLSANGLVYFTASWKSSSICSPNYLLYCPCYWISRTGLNVFRFLLGGLYIGQQTSTEGRYSSGFGSAAGSCLFSKN